MSSPTPASQQRTWQQRWDDAPTPEKLKRAEKVVILGIVAVVLVLCAGVALLTTRYLDDPWSAPNWESRADTVAAALNDRYVEDIQVQREQDPGGVRTGGHRVEIFVIDGRLRDDCTVKDDRHPVLTCVGLVRLHEER